MDILMKQLKNLHELSREDLEEHCDLLQVEVNELKEEKGKLQEAGEELLLLAKQNQQMADNYQRMFNELFQIIKTKYDSEFTVGDIPRHLS